MGESPWSDELPASSNADNAVAGSDHPSESGNEEPVGSEDTSPDAVGPTAQPLVEPSRSRWHAYRTQRRLAKASRSKLRRRVVRATLVVLLLIVVLIGGSIGYAFYRFNQVSRVNGGRNVIGAPKQAGTPENILLIGSTDRCAAASLTLKVFREECESGVNGINSDVVMIVRISPIKNSVTLLSIPRDTFVPDARSGGLYNKIDAALYDGPAQLATAITQDFGITINHFVDLNFGTFDAIVGALGGIDMYFPDRLYDGDQPPLDINRTGCIHLDGIEALELVRARTLYYFTKGEVMNIPAMNTAEAKGSVATDSGGTYDGTGDLGRITRVHLFLRVLASAVAKRGLGSFSTDNALVGAIAPDLTVDNTLGDLEMVHIGREVDHANIGDAAEFTVPIVNDSLAYSYKGYPYGDVVFPTEPQDRIAIAKFLGETSSVPNINPSAISVSVIDGSDSTTATIAVSNALHAVGFPIVPTAATNYVGPISETSVIYTPGHLKEAERVIAALRGPAVLGVGTPAGGAKISVIAGTDLTVVGSASANTTASTATSAGASVALTSYTSRIGDHRMTPTLRASISGEVASTMTTTKNPDLGPATSSDPGVAPWDPRACPVSTH